MPCIIGRLYSTCRRVQRMLLTAYGRSVLVYQVSFPRDTYRRSGGLFNNRQKLSKIGLAVLFTDYGTTSNESMLATHSHLLPILPSRASSLLPSCLAELTHKPAGSRSLYRRHFKYKVLCHDDHSYDCSSCNILRQYRAPI